MSPNRKANTIPKYLVPQAAPASRPAANNAAAVERSDSSRGCSTVALRAGSRAFVAAALLIGFQVLAAAAAISAAAQQNIARPLSIYAKPKVLFTGPMANNRRPASRPGTPLPRHRKSVVYGKWRR